MVKIDYSVVVPVYNEEGNILELYKRLHKIFEKNSWELIFINDSSKDKSLEIIKSLSEKDKSVKYLSFSRNFGHQAGLTAGMDYAQGKAIITMDCDMQDPPEIIPEMIRKWNAGNDVVYARRKNRKDNFFKKWTAIGYYKLLDKFSDVKIPRNVGDYRLVDRQVLDQLKGMKEKARYLRGMVAWLGFKYDFVDYDRPDRFSGETGYTITKMMRLAMDGILNFSMFPLKVGLLLGMLSIFSGCLFLLYMIIDTLRVGIGEYPLYKWLSVGFLIMIGFLFILIWILGEYIGRIYDESKGRPLYVIRENNIK
ncbi:MAG: glycosyltransferase family 2 protein [archaeon]